MSSTIEEVGVSDLVGLHELSGVDFGQLDRDPNSYFSEPCQTMSFVLDGVVYTAIEDPSDGYRSMLARLEVGGAVGNRFPPCAVMGIMRPAQRWRSGSSDILQLYDVATGKLVLEVGTDDYDDYYPTYIATFDPTAMAINQGR